MARREFSELNDLINKSKDLVHIADKVTHRFNTEFHTIAFNTN